MDKYDVIVIGSGLGGLLTAYTLSKEGFKVCVLEKNDRVGGCIQSFVRDGVVFNTGFNYTESLAPGEVLNKYFSYFDLMDLNFQQLDVDGFERISFGTEDKEYRFAQGHEHFIDTLAQDFPRERKSLENYIKGIAEVAHHFPMYQLDHESQNWNLEFNMTAGMDDFLQSITTDKRLQNVLAGTNSLYGAVKDKTPLYIHALINYSFIASAWRLVDGGSKLAVKQTLTIKKNGGEIYRNKEVSQLVNHTTNDISVICTDGSEYRAKKVVSSLHPATTLRLLDPTSVRKAFRSRIDQLEQTVGMFSLYIVLKENTFKYQNYNNHYYAQDNIWTAEYTSWPEHYMLYTQATSKTGEYANGITVLTYMKYSDVKKWENTKVGNRGQEYLDFKHQKAEQLLDLIEIKFPHIRSCIKSYYTSTPLTYRDYTGTVDGSSYGILKDYKHSLRSLILPNGPVPNLLFTGQNLNMHGILGVAIGAISTSAEFVGMEYLLKKIKNS